MLTILQKLLPRKFVDFLRIRRYEKNVLQGNFENHLLKQQTIQHYARQHGLEVLIETGTYIGRMIAAQLPFFKKIISIEINQPLFNYNKQKFRREEKVTLLLGDSSTLIKQVCGGLTTPALFWLDAHYSGGLTGKGLLDTPVVEELKSIFANNYNHCILVDDARLFNGTNDYPEYESLKSFITDSKPNASVTIVNDIIVIDYAE